MREKIINYIAEQYQKHVRDKVGVVKTKLGQQTAENMQNNLKVQSLLTSRT